MIWFRNPGWFSCVVALTTLGWFPSGVAGQDPQPPYRVPVVGEDATVHAGPGSTHYATDQLSPGATVDVYRHDPGGWMAIRPPESSFSLLQRDELEILPDGLARVKYDDTVAWVGTSLSAVDNPMWQIRLNKGEIVEVLGMVDRQQYELESGEPDWVQIMPPAGEFRWIAASDLDLTRSQPLPKPARQPEIAEASPVPATDADSNSTQQASHDWPQTPIVDEPATTASEPSPATALPQTGSRQGVQGWQPAQQTISNFVEQRSDFREDTDARQATSSGWNKPPDEFADSHQRADIFDFDGTGHSSQPAFSGTPDQELGALDM